MTIPVKEILTPNPMIIDPKIKDIFLMLTISLIHNGILNLTNYNKLVRLDC